MLPLVFAVDEVEVILHVDEAGPAILLGDVQCLSELLREHGGGTDIRTLPALTKSCSASIVSSIGVW
jgi:hypothetical protein